MKNPLIYDVHGHQDEYHGHQIVFAMQAFSGNGLKTIITKDKNYQDIIGNSPGLSFKDIQATTLMYKCDSKSPIDRSLHCSKKAELQ